MSQTVSRFVHPFDVVHHPTLEPEVKRAILASWASDRVSRSGPPGTSPACRAGRAIPIDDVLAALHALDSTSQFPRACSNARFRSAEAASGRRPDDGRDPLFPADYPSLLQLFIWQDYDEAPDFRRFASFSAIGTDKSMGFCIRSGSHIAAMSGPSLAKVRRDQANLIFTFRK